MKSYLHSILSVLLIFTATFSRAQAPDWEWAKTANGTWGDWTHAIAVDANGNSYVTGYFEGATIAFDGITLTNPDVSATYAEVFVAKYDSLGNVVWAQRAGNTNNDKAFSISIDSNGDILLAGVYSIAITFGSTVLTGGGNFLVKYAPSGSVIWAIGNDYYTPYVLSTDSNGNIYTLGTFSFPSITIGSTTLLNASGSGSSKDIVLVKRDPSGNVLWAKSAGGVNQEEGTGLAIDTSGNPYITGIFYSPTIVFGSVTLTNASSTGAQADYFITKFDSSGNTLWAQRAGGTATEIESHIAIDAAGNLHVAGAYYSTSITFGSTTLTNMSGGIQLFVVEYDSSGNVIWAKKSVGSVFSSGIVVDAFGNSYVVGSNDGPATIGSLTMPYPAGGYYDSFVIKYDNLGNAIWVKRGTGAANELASGIGIDANNNLYVLGHYTSYTAVFDAFTIANPDLYYELFLAKIDGDQSQVVWPGDTDYNYSVNNSDLLPIGLFYGQTGVPRVVAGNVWQADTSLNWGIVEANGVDIKHADCNGDGVIDSNDTLAINLNYSLTHTFAPSEADERAPNPNLYFSSTSGTYPPGTWINIDVMAGTSLLPVDNLYGIVFNMVYNASLVQPGTESLIYPNSWFANPGIDAIKIEKIDAFGWNAFAGETRIDHVNRDGYGKIATFRFQAKSSISSLTTMNFSYSGYMANDSVGNSLFFNPQSYSVVIDPLATTIEEEETINEMTVFPNPNNGNFNVMFTSQEKSNYKLELRNILGQVVYQETLPDFIGTYSKPISISSYGKGVYTITLSNERNEVVKKIIVY